MSEAHSTRGPKIVEPDTVMSDAVRHAMRSDPSVRRLWEGKGKRGGDTSDAGYDWSIMERLVKEHEIRDLVDLVTACRWRSCYTLMDANGMSRLVARLNYDAEKLIRSASEQDRSAPQVERVTVYKSQPPTYEIHTPGGSFKCSTGDLMSPARFAQRYTEAFLVIPTLPRKPDRWVALVNEWLACADVVEQPEEASDEGHALEVITAALRGMPLVDDEPDFVDLDRAAVRIEGGEHIGRWAVKLKTVLQKVQLTLSTLTPHALGVHLRKLKYEPAANSVRVGSGTARVWMAPVTGGLHTREAESFPSGEVV